MKFQIEFINILVWKLNFNLDVPCTDFKTDLPLLINEKNDVVLGNSLRKNYGMMEEVKCIIIEQDKYLEKSLLDIELAVIEENSKDRYYAIEKELKKYLSDFKNDFELISLFNIETEKDFITEENYLDPGDYDFTKHNVVDRKDKNEDEEVGYAGLFSDSGECKIP